MELDLTDNTAHVTVNNYEDKKYGLITPQARLFSSFPYIKSWRQYTSWHFRDFQHLNLYTLCTMTKLALVTEFLLQKWVFTPDQPASLKITHTHMHTHSRICFLVCSHTFWLFCMLVFCCFIKGLHKSFVNLGNSNSSPARPRLKKVKMQQTPFCSMIH